jgi:hypothetical protein
MGSYRKRREEGEEIDKEESYTGFTSWFELSREYLDHTVSTAADDPTAVTAPDYGAYTFATHQSVACQLLGTAALLKVPEAQACVMAS